jgi:HAD superfamily hydrolase (TIGR01509 family)
MAPDYTGKMMVNWSRIDTVLLDMDGTLLDLYFDNYFWLEFLPGKYAAHHHCDLPSASRYLTELSASLHGTLDWYCLDYWSTELQMDVEALKRELQHLIRFRPGAPEFLAFLAAQGKRAVLVTNAHPKALKLKLEASGLGLHLAQHVSSHDLQLAKENAGFWLRLQEARELDLGRCLFIDDSLNVLRRARAEGVGYTVQVLQPDMTLPPRAPSEFPGILNFAELMRA